MDFVKSKVLPYLKKEDEAINPPMTTYEMKVTKNTHL